MFYVYSFLLMLIFFILYKSIYFCKMAVPSKIKLLSLCALGALAIRYIAVLVLFLINNIKYLYLLKSIYLLNYICIPVIALTAMYILGRSDKIKFNVVYTIAGSIVILYVVSMIFSISSVRLTEFGYTIRIAEPRYFIYGYILLNVLLVVIAAMLLKKKHINKFGIYLAFITAVAATVELILMAIGVNIFPQNVIGDTMWLVVYAYAIGQFEK